MTRRLVVAIASTVIAAFAPLAAQDQSPTEGLVRLNKVPVSSELLRISLPKAQEADLANGLHLIVLEDHRVPQVSFQLVIPGAGGYADPADRPGLASFTAGLMREGTTTRSADEISRQLEVMAATLNVGAATGSPEASVSGSALSDQFEPLLGLGADVLLHPAFANEELARYKVRMRASLVQQRANPTFLAVERFGRAVYGDHPAARLSPTLASLEAVTRDAIVVFHRTHYVPDHAALAIAGDVTMAEARRMVEAALGAWAKSGAAKGDIPEPAPLTRSNIYFVERPASVQTSLVVGTQAIDRTSDEYDLLQVMNKIIGGGPTGRLFLHLREAKGYTYGAYSYLDAREHTGDWEATTNVRTEVTEPALTDLLAEIRTLRDVAVPTEELADAKRSLIASFALSLESPSRLVDYHLTRWRFGLAADYWDGYAERINAVTAAEVQAAARKYLAADRLQIVAVGDPARVLAPLEKLGAVQTFDAEGNRTDR
jgi:zinc protease